MPGPAPPSASYLLVFDTDSEEEEDEYYPRPVPPPSRSTPVEKAADSAFRIRNPPTEEASKRRGAHVVEDDEDDDDDEDDHSEDSKSNKVADGTAATTTTTTIMGGDDGAPKKLTKTQKKNKARRKKKKSKQNSNSTEGGGGASPTNAIPASTQTKNSAAAATAKVIEKKSISFSNVSIRSYDRCFSADTVPLDGGWPLGSELYKFEDHDEISLEDFESHKQETLQDRWEVLKTAGKVDDEIAQRLTKRPSGSADDFVLETRQWDYLSGRKNPLFRPLAEEERQQIFLQYSNESPDVHNNILVSGGPPSPPSSKGHGRTRSSSVSSISDISVGSNGGSGGGSSPRRRNRSNSVSQTHQFNETYDQVYVHHVRHELEELRNDRTKSGATGCNCRKLTVYLPPKDGSGGKKAQHRRMKPSKVVNELKKRGIYNSKSSREELEITLHDAVEKEPCCSGNDCFCARNGIDCQADACSCWHDSHVHTKPCDKKKNGSSSYLSVAEITERCGNPMGTSVCDIAAIDEFRTKLLSSGICQPVSMAI